MLLLYISGNNFFIERIKASKKKGSSSLIRFLSALPGLSSPKENRLGWYYTRDTALSKLMMMMMAMSMPMFLCWFG